MTMRQLHSVEEIRDVLQRYDDSATRKLTDRVESLEVFAEKLFRYAENYVMVQHNTELGFISFYANDMVNRRAYLTVIAVDARYQKKGIGSLALQFMLDECRARQMATIRLEVDTMNDNAIGFYQMHGFSIVEEASDVSVIMEREV